MNITIADIESANFEGFTQAGAQLGAQAATVQQHGSTSRQAITGLDGAWEGQAFDAATARGQRTLQQQQKLSAALQRIQSALCDDGAQLAATRSSIVQGVDQLRGQGWQVAQDGTVSVQPGGPLDMLAQDSPVIEMQLRALAATSSVELKTLIVDLDTGDRQLAQKLREALHDLEDADDKPEDDKPEDDKPDEPDSSSQPGQNPAEIAREYQGRWATDLMQNSDLPMRPGVDPTECCANFASAVLVKAGIFDPSEQTPLVKDMYDTLQQKGWQTVPAGQLPPPGAVAIFGANHNQHVEFVDNTDGGQITLIGSNNTGGGSGPQQVSTESPWSNDVVYLVPPS